MVVTTPASEFGPLLDEALALEFEGKSEEERREGISDADLDLVRKLLLASAQRALETQQFEDYCREVEIDIFSSVLSVLTLIIDEICANTTLLTQICSKRGMTLEKTTKLH